MLMAMLFTIANRWDQSRCLSVGAAYTPCNIIQPPKRMKSFVAMEDTVYMK